MVTHRSCMSATILIGAFAAGCASGDTATLQPATLTTAATPAVAPAAVAAPAPAASPAPAPATGARIQKVAAKTQTAGTMQPDGTYAMSADELKLDCKKLTGRVVVRILQMRNHEIRNHSSGVSRTAQQAVTPIFGGTTFGSDPDADYRRDRALVEAYNKRLAAMKCKVFDLVKELQPKPAGETPTPVQKK